MKQVWLWVKTMAGALADAAFEYVVPRLFRVLLIIAVAAFLVGALLGARAATADVTTRDFGALAQAELAVHKLEGMRGSCSAVAIAPGLAASAEHCSGLVPGGTLLVRGVALPIAGALVSTDRDQMIIDVPGLECPCVPIDARNDVRVGETVAVVGYPYGTERLTNSGPKVFMMQAPDALESYLVVRTTVAPGMSGGGAFLIREGRVTLVGVISRTDSMGLMALISVFKE
jgi:hypothetical protein